LTQYKDYYEEPIVKLVGRSNYLESDKFGEYYRAVEEKKVYTHCFNGHLSPVWNCRPISKGKIPQHQGSDGDHEKMDEEFKPAEPYIGPQKHHITPRPYTPYRYDPIPNNYLLRYYNHVHGYPYYHHHYPHHHNTHHLPYHHYHHKNYNPYQPYHHHNNPHLSFSGLLSSHKSSHPSRKPNHHSHVPPKDLIQTNTDTTHIWSTFQMLAEENFTAMGKLW